MLKVTLIIPTLNGGAKFQQLLESLARQNYPLYRQIIIDSQSTDNTVDLAKKFGFEVINISPNDFNHGSTRQQGVELAKETDIVLFLTQDAVLCDEMAVGYLVASFSQESVGAAYGRQIPHKDAGPIEAHARFFNYPDNESKVKSIEDAQQTGIKVAFISNSFAAYRAFALKQAKGFPSDTILGEDMYVAAKLLLKGWKIAYCSEAQVYHSHSYSYLQEFRRYFDTGVFHARESWMLRQFGQVRGEGFRYVRSELTYLWNHHYKRYIPEAIIRTSIKVFAYTLGTLEEKIPNKLKEKLSMHYRYWSKS